jgi:hypothetical protein
MTRNGIQRGILAVALCAVGTIMMTGCAGGGVRYKPAFDWSNTAPTSEATKLRKELKKTVTVEFRCMKSNAFLRGTKKAALYGDEWGELIINDGLVAKFHKYHAPQAVTIPVTDGINIIQIQYVRKKFGKMSSPLCEGYRFWIHHDFKDPHIIVAIEDNPWLLRTNIFTGYRVQPYQKFREGSPDAYFIFSSKISTQNANFAKKPLTPPYVYSKERKYKYEE